MLITYFLSTWDFEPPSCSFCPGDIIREELERQVRVSWEWPICSDNSGLRPTISSNRQSGAIFDVPGLYNIQYTISDSENNVNKNCSFRIILKGNALLITVYLLSRMLCDWRIQYNKHYVSNLNRDHCYQCFTPVPVKYNSSPGWDKWVDDRIKANMAECWPSSCLFPLTRKKITTHTKEHLPVFIC